MTTPTQLSVYNGALTILGQQELSALTENTPRRHYLDEVWSRNFRDRVLQLRTWDWAKRTSKLTYDSSIDPSFGMSRYIPWPSDYMRLIALSSNGYFRPPMTGDDYRIEGGYFVCDWDEIYIQYVSNDSSYGLDYTLWPETFTSFTEACLALWTEPKITQGRKAEEAQAAYEYWFRQSGTLEAQQAGSKKPTTSSWLASRGSRGGQGSRAARNIPT